MGNPMLVGLSLSKSR
uniref:Uncharacterized protein n=1 Tax=Anguilla anguilla TaxID=7936 RepID=A0A0E9QJN4_ANGAN